MGSFSLWHPLGFLNPGNNTLELFGDINSSGHITYVQYDCNFANGTLTRTSTDILNAAPR